MLKSKALIFGIISAVLLIHGSSVFPAEAVENTRARTRSSTEYSGDILGFYEKDGGKTVIPIVEKAGMAERLPEGMTLGDILR